MELIYLIIILSIAISIKLISNIKIEQTIFITICSFFAIEFISGIISNLNIGYYVVISISVFSLLFIIYKGFKKSLDVMNIVTPGFVLFVLSYIIYYISSQGAMVSLWDEATHWGTTAKRMAYSSQLWTTGLQTIASPVFNFVMLKTTGFNESALYLSQWTLSIACIILPLTHITWKKAYLAMIYFAGCVFGLSLLCQNGNLTLYADTILALFFSSMVLAWYKDKELSYKKYTWSCLGIFMLVQIKSGTGISLAILFIIFSVLLDRIILNKQYSLKQHINHSIKSILILSIPMLVSQKIYADFNNTFTGRESSFSDTLSLFKLSPLFLSFIIVSLILLANIAIYLIHVYKGKTACKSFKWTQKCLWAIGMLSVIVLAGLLLHGAILRPNFDIRTTVINFISAFSKYTILGIQMKYICVIVVILFGANIILNDKEKRKKYLVFYTIALFALASYIGGILYTYIIKFSLHEAVITASFDRYMSTALLFSFVFILLPFLETNFKIRSKKQIIKYSYLIVLLILLFSQWTPTYKLVQKTSTEAKGIRIDKKIAGEYVRRFTNHDEKVFIVIQQDEGLNFHWMRYELLPIPTNGGYWSFGDGGNHQRWESKDMQYFFVKKTNYTYSYLYLHKTDETFKTRFIDLFDGIAPEARTLYKILYNINEDGDILLTKVDE